MRFLVLFFILVSCGKWVESEMRLIEEEEVCPTPIPQQQQQQQGDGYAETPEEEECY